MTDATGPAAPRPLAVALAACVAMLLLVGPLTLGYRLGVRDRGAQLPRALSAVGVLYQRVLDDAVEVPEPEALVEGAAAGLLETLDDPYAVYYDAERYERLAADLDGEFVGVGITIEQTDAGVIVSGILPGSPAEEAGVMAGERITSVDGTPVTPETTSGDVVEQIAGPAGTVRTIGLDGGEAGARQVTLTLRVLELPQVTSRVLDGGYGYVRVAQFTRDVAERMGEVLEQFQRDGVPGVVLDLRGNPGGLLDEAVDVVGLFVEEGVAVRVEDGDAVQERRVSGGAVAPDLPLVVLVDGNSASASEIVAGAIQDLGRGQVLGTRTFGKGTVQTIQDLAGGAGVKFTTARYLTPSGDSIEGVGVAPDAVLEGTPDEVLARAAELLAASVAADGQEGQGQQGG
jgi:carboxyl-terminal processing protease